MLFLTACLMKPPSSSRRGGYIKCIVSWLWKCALAAALLVWLFRSGRMSVEVFSRVRLGWPMLAASACYGLALILPLVRWRVLVRTQGLPLSLGRCLQIGFIGYLASIVLPTWIGEDGARLVCGSRHCQGRMDGLVSTVVMDRALGLIGLLVLALIFGSMLLLTTTRLAIVGVLIAAALLLIALCGSTVALSNRRFESLLLRIGVAKRLASVLRVMQVYGHHRRAVAEAFVLSVLAHLAGVSAAYFTFAAIDFYPSIVCVYAITPLVNVSNMLPLSPLGLGVGDSVAAVTYPLVGIAGGAEVTMTLRAVHVVLVLTCVVTFGLLGMAFSRMHGKPEPAPGTCDTATS